jgi:hypothetical protein
MHEIYLLEEIDLFRINYSLRLLINNGYSFIPKYYLDKIPTVGIISFKPYTLFNLQIETPMSKSGKISWYLTRAFNFTTTYSLDILINIYKDSLEKSDQEIRSLTTLLKLSE